VIILPHRLALALVWLRAAPVRVIAFAVDSEAMVNRMGVVYVRHGVRKTQALAGPWSEVWAELRRQR
jgi:hypothetical protein